MRPSPLFSLAASLCSLAAGAALSAQEPARDYASAIVHLEAMARREIERGLITGLSIALVDDQRVVWAAGLGLADKAGARAAAPDTVYRAGSVSKLFTALGVMMLVEEGRLDLDAPIERYVPEFSIGKGRFPDAKPATLRQLMSHRSGFVRESPVGSYFDGDEPSLEASVRSLSRCELVHAPETVTKYSNIGVALEGYVLERAAGIGFEEFQRRRLLDPLGMASSDFRFSDRVRARAAKGYMTLADGRAIEAPRFELGTIPAGNLYASALDLARLAMFIFREGRVESGALLRPEALRSMFEVQYAGDGQKTGFGLGFFAGDLDGRKWVGHAGAVYGFSTQLLALPEEKLAAVVCANDDVVNAAAGAIARRAVQWMLALREGKSGPAPPDYLDLDAKDLAPFEGHFRHDAGWMELRRRPSRLVAHHMGMELDLRAVAPGRFLAYGGVYEAPLEFAADRAGFEFQGKTFVRFDPKTMPSCPEAFRDYLGSYGPWYIPTVISFANGHLYALVENAFGYILKPVGADAFDFPAGLYEGEQLVFERDAGGRVRGLRIGPVPFERQRASWIDAEDAWTLWAAMVLWVALSILLEQRYRWANKVSGPVLVMLGAIALANCRIGGAPILPPASPVYDAVWRYIVPVCVPLLLLRANLKTIVRDSGWLFLVFHLAAIGSIAGAFLAAWALKGAGIESLGGLIGIMTGSYIGGSINFVALSSIFAPEPGLANSLIVADNLVMALLFLACFSLTSVPFLRKRYPAPYQDAVERDGAGAATLAASHWRPKPIALIHIAAALAIAVAVAAASHHLAAFFRRATFLDRTSALGGFASSVLEQPFLLMTVLCVAIATLFHRRLERLAGAEELGTWLIYLFFFVIGAPADLVKVFRDVPALFVLCGIMALVNLAVTLALTRLFRRTLEEAAMAVNATLGGPASAAALAIGKGWQPLVLPGILVGIWGYVIGTFLGSWVGRMLIGWGF